MVTENSRNFVLFISSFWIVLSKNGWLIRDEAVKGKLEIRIMESAFFGK